MFFLKKILTTLVTCIICFHCANASATLYIVVNKDNSLTSISRNTLKRIYLGKVVNVPGSKRAFYPIDLPTRSKARSEFLQKVIQMKASLLMQYRSRQIFSGRGRLPLTASGNRAVESLIARRSNAIGYLSSLPSSSKVKTILVL